MKALASAALALLAAACTPAGTAQPAPAAAPAAAPAPAAAAALNPVGKFEFTSMLSGRPLEATVEVTGGPGAYAGQIVSNASPPIAISNVTVNGQEIVVTGQLPDGTLTIHMNFTDAQSFTGNWSLNGQGAPLSGHRAT